MRLRGKMAQAKARLCTCLPAFTNPTLEPSKLTDAVVIDDEQAAQRLGIPIVYQERSLFDLLTVSENLFVSRPPVNRWSVIDRRGMRRRARQLLQEVGLGIEPDVPVGSLPPARQQMVEIAKALSLRSRIFILDEPTAAITLAETKLAHQGTYGRGID
jgi:ABC-type sugar transport system ATPase subunit